MQTITPVREEQLPPLEERWREVARDAEKFGITLATILELNPSLCERVSRAIDDARDRGIVDSFAAVVKTDPKKAAEKYLSTQLGDRPRLMRDLEQADLVSWIAALPEAKARQVLATMHYEMRANIESWATAVDRVPAWTELVHPSKYDVHAQIYVTDADADVLRAAGAHNIKHRRGPADVVRNEPWTYTGATSGCYSPEAMRVLRRVDPDGVKTCASAPCSEQFNRSRLYAKLLENYQSEAVRT